MIRKYVVPDAFVVKGMVPKNRRTYKIWILCTGTPASEGTIVPAEVFQFGLPEALWRECQHADLVSLVDAHCPQRNQGLTAGQYLIEAVFHPSNHCRNGILG